MRKFDKRVKPGTKVRGENGSWYTVKAVHESRKWIEVNDVCGNFQYGHISKFSNK